MKLRALLVSVFATVIALNYSVQAEPAGQSEIHLQAIAWNTYQDEAVRLLQEYLRIDTSNPPGNELAAAQFFHRLFDQAGDVRRAGDQSGRKVQRWHFFRLGRFEETQGIVLLSREVVAAEEFIFQQSQAVVGPPQIQKRLLLGRIESAGTGSLFGDRVSHENNNTCSNKCCPDRSEGICD